MTSLAAIGQALELGFEVGSLTIGRITVAFRDTDRYAVLDGSLCLGKDGGWEFEGSPSSRTDAFKANYRFPIEEAIMLAWREHTRMTDGAGQTNA